MCVCALFRTAYASSMQPGNQLRFSRCITEASRRAGVQVSGRSGIAVPWPSCGGAKRAGVIVQFVFLICSKNCSMCKNEWGAMKREAQEEGVLHAYRWLRKEADWKLALESLVAFKKFRDEWDFTNNCFPFVERVPADVLLAKPPTLTAVLLNMNPGPVVPANSEDPWPLSDVDNERRVRCRRA